MRAAAVSLLSALALAAPGLLWAQTVALSGILGNKALLVVGSGAPRAVAAGETHQGVKVLAVRGDEATVEIEGKRATLRLGEAPVSVAGSTGAGRRVVLKADSRGHFTSQGAINGRPMQYMVDTGASVVAIGVSDAQRLGLNYKEGQSVRMGTANGVTQAWRVRLDSLRVGDIEVFGVEAVVTPQPMPFVLLGNSFLSAFQMTRDSHEMVLEKRR